MIQEGCETKHLGLFECGWQRCIANTTKNVTGRDQIWCLWMWGRQYCCATCAVSL